MPAQVALTVVGSLGFFLLFTVSLGFWGRLLLRLVGVKDNIGYGSPLPMVTSVSVLVVIVRYLHYVTTNFDFLFSLVFILGISGFLAELILFFLRSAKTYVKKTDILKDFVVKHSSILVGALLCVVFSTYLSLLWPSGRMEPWLSENIDYYSWIFLSDYWRGLVDLSKMGLYGFSLWIFDSFGSFIFFGMFAASMGGPTFTVAPYFLVALLSWIGISVYRLVRSVFGLPFALSFLLALGLVGGNFFNMLSLLGMFGHLVGLFGFLTCLNVVFDKGDNLDLKGYCITLFFPTLFLYVSYPAVFLVFMAMVLLAIFLEEINTNSPKLGDMLKAFSKSLKKSLIVVGFPVLASCIFVPQVTFRIFTRIFEAATQKEGFTLKLIEPVFFSGVPLYNDNLVYDTTNGTYISYVFYVVSIIILAMFVCGKSNVRLADSNKNKIKAITLLLLACVAVYLSYYWVKGDLYIVWKYAAYSILPLAFVASSLFCAALSRLSGGKHLLFSVFCAITAIIVLTVPILAINSPFYGHLGKSTSNKSLTPLIMVLDQAETFDQGKSRFIFDLWSAPMNVAAALISVPSKKEIYLTHTIYFFYGLNNYFPKMDENAVIYTDKEFGGMYNSYVTRPEGFTLYRYFRSDLEEMGAVAYYGMVPYTTRPIDSEVKVKILVPNSLRGKDLRLRLEVPYSNTASKPQCQAVEVSYEDGRAIPGGTYEEGFFMADIKMEEQIKGFLDLSVRLPGEPQPSEPQSGPKGDGLVCGFDFKGVSLDILNNPIAPEP